MTALESILLPRLSVFLRKNIDGTYGVSISGSNAARPNRKRRIISIRGYDLQSCIEIASKQLMAAIEANEIVP